MWPNQLTFTNLSGDFHTRDLLRAAHNPDSWARSVTCPGEAFSRSFGINQGYGGAAVRLSTDTSTLHYAETVTQIWLLPSSYFRFFDHFK
jgi:hypothetical protein|tara:strand:- start:604 stop:873 length:270 start_codon:yes stop_codon:yes gene_type:complete